MHALQTTAFSAFNRLAAACLPLAAAMAIGCAPQIGDNCRNSFDCSPNGDRVCDVAQPGGYCTIQRCDGDTCPKGSVCVEWLGMPPRTAESWCMGACSKDKDCRSEYNCFAADELRSVDGLQQARVLDTNQAEQRFCAAEMP